MNDDESLKLRESEFPQSEDVDLVLRHVSRQFPDALVRGLWPRAHKLEVQGWLDTQVTSKQRRLDRALRVNVDGAEQIVHLEWQYRWEASVPFRMFEYNVMMATLDEVKSEGIPIESTVVLLSGREALWSDWASYRTSSEKSPFSGVHFRVDAVYQRTVSELAARGPFWSVFAPLAIDAEPSNLKRIVERLGAETPREEFAELGAAMVAIADADGRKRQLAHVLHSILGQEIVMQNSIYALGHKDGIDKGRQEGIDKGAAMVTARQFERRLGRPLTPDEHTLLLRRLTTLGPSRLGDVVLDLEPSALAAWLTDPSAT